jgi:hypothetical protein
VNTAPAGTPDLYVLASHKDNLASTVFMAAIRRGVRAMLCKRYEYGRVLTVEVGSYGVRVTPDRPVFVRQHRDGVPWGPDARFISEEVNAHVKGGLSLLNCIVVNRPRLHGESMLLPPVIAQYHLRANALLDDRVTLAPELFRDSVHGDASGWEMQDMQTREGRVGGKDTSCETPQRLRRFSRPFRYVSVLVVGTRTWVQVGASNPLAEVAQDAAAAIVGMAGLQLAEITFKSIEGGDTLEVARIDANPRAFPAASIMRQAAEALLDLLIS